MTVLDEFLEKKFEEIETNKKLNDRRDKINKEHFAE
jgi:hypothetical protein